MKKKYDQLEIEICKWSCEDVITLSSSGEIDGDETKYPVPWLGA